MVSLTIVGCLVPYNDAELLNGNGSSDANASPFVIAVKNAGITAVPSIMNVGIPPTALPGKRTKLTFLRLLFSLPC
jgi:amino acid permease